MDQAKSLACGTHYLRISPMWMLSTNAPAMKKSYFSSVSLSISPFFFNSQWCIRWKLFYPLSPSTFLLRRIQKMKSISYQSINWLQARFVVTSFRFVYQLMFHPLKNPIHFSSIYELMILQYKNQWKVAIFLAVLAKYKMLWAIHNCLPPVDAKIW